MTELLDRLLASVERQEPVARVVVLRAPPPLAAGVGRQALVWVDRPPFGSLGLGALEDEALTGASQQLNRRRHGVLTCETEAGEVELFVEVQARPPTLMIGSKRRIKAVFELLERERRLTREALGKVYAPIGLDIGAKSPAEIAVAIMGEIIMVRRGGHGHSPVRCAAQPQRSRSSITNPAFRDT